MTITLILLLVIGVNITLRANSEDTSLTNQSLFFDYLAKNSGINDKVVDAYASTITAIGGNYSFIPQTFASSEGAEIKEEEDTQPLPTLSGQALLKPNPSSSDGSVGTQRDVEQYVVQPGDTLAHISVRYGVSTDTIRWANNINSDLIKPGQTLSILPTTGVLHTIEKGESLYSIAKKYNVDVLAIMDFNQIEIPELIMPGEQLIIPNGVKNTAPTQAQKQLIANLQHTDVQTAQVPADYQGSSTGYVWPIPGCTRISQGFKRFHYAIDIPCKYQSVVAVADGVVESSGWSGGYGYQILINHGNGVKTRYAHASDLLVKAGDRITQGQSIMISGNTGRSTGPHLHFEIIQNGSFLNPLSVVSR